MEHILESAKILKSEQNIVFRLIGDGQTFAEAKQYVAEHNLSNVELVGWIPEEQLPVEIAKADVTLGIFGTSAKAQRVIPNKVYQALAMRKTVITGDTVAIRDAFGTAEAVYAVPCGDGMRLADAINKLRRSPDFRRCLGENGFRHFSARFTPTKVAEQFIQASTS